ncbi:MAG: DUF4114 domain-containing protein [Spirulinaceae cyanobacterium SM2_1_0]|nr:DUF4114 domain-containing protein [Spirulinaceae cyanobacterium SM2_1_0]
MTYTLQILHTADQEAGLPAIQDAVNFSAVLNALEDDFANTLKLSSGDIYIPGPFFSASDEIYGAAGVGDILINNALGFQAVAFGNHEFDLGTGTVRELLLPNPGFTGPGITGTYQGAQFPYLSANLDFSTDDNLDDLVVADGQAPQPNSIASSVVINVNGENIGVVGATTPTLNSISSPGGVTVLPPNSTDFVALAAIIQAEVDELTATGINKVVLLSHMQQIGIETQLAGLLEDVDVIMAGGSNTLLANADDPLRVGDTAADVYPLDLTSRSGERVVLINTDGNYQYVGRLAVEFDSNGLISSILDESGAYATDDAGVDRVYGMDVNPADVADPTVVAVTAAIGNVVLSKDGNIFGKTNVFLNGTRGDVRTQETNLGNLTADANLFVAQQYDPSVVISIKNGGGIRDNIGVSRIPAGGTSSDLEQLPPEANPLVGKEAGDISQLDIENSLRFNNDLTLLTVTAEELRAVIEHGVAATAPGATPGQFSQVSGLSYSFDPDLPAGQRVQTLAVKDEDGENLDIIVTNGQLVGDPQRTFRIVTLGFLADGGDEYPFDMLSNPDRVDLVGAPLPTGAVDVANFTDDGSEQDALAEYLAANFGTEPFSQADVPPSEDQRIRNLNFTQPGEGGTDGDPIEQLPNNVFELNGAADEVLRLRLTLQQVGTGAVNEIGVFKVDDDDGSVAGQRPGDAGYLQAALAQSRVVFSALPDTNFERFSSTRILEYDAGDRLMFFLVQNGTIDRALQNPGGAAVFFANNGNALRASEIASGNFELRWEDGVGAVDFSDVVLRLEFAPSAPIPVGTRWQGDNEREIIDLRDVGARTASIQIRSEAAFANTVGLYSIDSIDGRIGSLNPGDAGYARAAAERLVTRFDRSGTSPTSLQGLLAPLIIANATIEQFLAENPDNFNGGGPIAYFPYIAANPDGVDHLRLLGDNLFGFEDLPGGGDFDYNDMVFQISFA